MAGDLILTIDSDDERDVQASAQPVAGSSKQGQSAKTGKKDAAAGKGKKRKRGQNDRDGQDDDEEAGMDRLFSFDALAGSAGGSSARVNGLSAWNLDDTIEKFRKKNAKPRVTVDNIIARRQTSKPAPELDEGDEAFDLEDDSEEFAGFGSEGDDSEEDASDGSANNVNADSGDDQSSPDLGSAEDQDNEEAIPSGEEDELAASDDDEVTLNDDSEYISPFAALANASTLLSDEEDDNAKGIQAMAKAVDPSASTYFAKAPTTTNSGPHVTSNQALSKDSSLPPFSALPGATLSRPILLGLASLHLTTPTPVQARTIPVALLGKDIVGSSITGSGKTVAFWVGVLERLLYRDKKQPAIRVVVICPTRELAVQVHQVGAGLARYTDIRFALCVGGLSLKAQEAELRTRPDVVVCTPGRLIDHVRNTAAFSLESLEILIIDEADRILEEGFKDELTEIINSCPHSRQTMLFSATITEDINTLTRLSLRKPVRIQIDLENTTSKNLVQQFIKIRSESSRPAVLVHLAQTMLTQGTIVFFRSKKGAHWIKILFGLLGLKAEELHGDLTQEQRLNSLKQFREGQVNFLLATDLASRGLDIKGITSVINYDAPKSFDIYLHRVGRTARAGKAGRAVTLISDNDNDERKLMKLASKSQLDSTKTGSGNKAKKEKEAASEKDENVSLLAIDNDKVKALAGEVAGLKGEILDILQEEKEEKELRSTEVQLQKGQNLLDHRDEIMSKPKRTWFQNESQKKTSREKGAVEWSDKIAGSGEGSSSRDRSKGKPVLNHKQKRRKEALDELKSNKRDAVREDAAPSRNQKSKTTMAAVKAVKRAARPEAIRQLKSDQDRKGRPDAGGKKKKKGKKGGGDKKVKSSFSQKGRK